MNILASAALGIRAPIIELLAGSAIGMSETAIRRKVEVGAPDMIDQHQRLCSADRRLVPA